MHHDSGDYHVSHFATLTATPRPKNRTDKRTDKRTDNRTDKRTDNRTDKPDKFCDGSKLGRSDLANRRLHQKQVGQSRGEMSAFVRFLGSKTGQMPVFNGQSGRGLAEVVKINDNPPTSPGSKGNSMLTSHSVRLRIGLILGLLLALAPIAVAENNDSVSRLRKDLTYLSGDECEGRGAETQGIFKAANYIVAEYEQLGLKPGGVAGSYFQPFSMRSGKAVMDAGNRLAPQGPLGQGIETSGG